MQYMKLSEVQREELIAALAGMKKFLREAFGSLPPEETRTPGPGLLLASGTGLAFGRPGVRVRSSHPAAANRDKPSSSGLRWREDRAGAQLPRSVPC